MAGEVFGFFAHHGSQPFADMRVVHIVVVHPTFVARVVRRVDIDAIHFSLILRQQRLECLEVVAVDNHIILAVAVGRIVSILPIRVLLFQDTVGDVVVMFLYFLFAYPMECGHNGLLSSGRPCPWRPIRIQKTWATIPVELVVEVLGNPYFRVRYIASTQVYIRHTRQGNTPLSCGGGIYTP